LNGLKIDLERCVPGLIVLAATIGLIFIVMDWGQIRKALMQASWKPIPYALAATFVSYTCISFSFARVSRLLGIEMSLKDLAIVGFVSTVLNHLVSGGGAAGYSVRFMLMKRHGVGMREVIATSILHFYPTSLMMIAMLPVGLIYLLLHASLSQTTAILLGILASILLLAFSLATGLVFWSSMRRRVIGVLVKATRTLIHRHVKEPLERFEATITLGIQAMREHPSSIVIIMILIMIDWVFSAIALWFSFRAFGTTPSPGQLVSGFVIGIVAGVASMIPGGIGIQEGSMAGIFALLGIAFERAVLASILFRVVYFVIPYLISLGFYRQLLRQKGNGQSLAAWEVDHENSDA
jgi:uncharacterized protein (TIRG00374 family)